MLEKVLKMTSLVFGSIESVSISTTKTAEAQKRAAGKDDDYHCFLYSAPSLSFLCLASFRKLSKSYDMGVLVYVPLAICWLSTVLCRTKLYHFVSLELPRRK